VQPVKLPAKTQEVIVMAILVDCSPDFKKGRSWYFMTSDMSVAELVIFAIKLGLKREWLILEGQLPRFEITSFFRQKALENKAKEVSSKELLAASEAIGKKYYES
jgi:hypothetical protein